LIPSIEAMRSASEGSERHVLGCFCQANFTSGGVEIEFLGKELAEPVGTLGGIGVKEASKVAIQLSSVLRIDDGHPIPPYTLVGVMGLLLLLQKEVLLVWIIIHHRLLVNKTYPFWSVRPHNNVAVCLKGTARQGDFSIDCTASSPS